MATHRISLSSTIRDSNRTRTGLVVVSKETDERPHTYCTVRRGRVVEEDDLQTDDFFLWQFCPNKNNNNNATETMAPTSILFLAHGCNHRMTDWWLPKSTDDDACPDCLGLPEERAIVQAALDRHFLVVALSSLHKCWSAMDATRVVKVLMQLQLKWSNKINKNPPPFLAFGASSGGHFVSSILPRSLEQHGTRLEGLISQIMATPIDIDDDHHSISNDVRLPKAVGYIVMSRDTRTDQQAQQRVQEWQTLGVPVQYRQVKPLAIGSDFFASRIPEIDHSLSKKLVQALHDARLLNVEAYLMQNPRRSEWRSVLELVLSRSDGHYKDTLIHDQSPLSEVMNVAWGEHEMTREGVNESFEFLLKHI